MTTSEHGHDGAYKWIALSNTTIGILMATINSSILLIALPDIFRGIQIDPLAPENTSYFLWILTGFMLVTSVLVVSLGRVGDMFGRVRMYNLGFAIFTVFSILLAVTWMHGTAAAWWLIVMRIGQGVGGAFLFANSSAIITDAFPENERGFALGINGVAAIGGSFLGLLVGGLLAPVEWHLVFLVSVPFGLFGTVWAYLKLRDNGVRTHARIDWAGNISFGVGLIAILTGIVYGLQPYGGHTMGWTKPFVLVCLFGGLAVLIGFVVIEVRSADPMFRLELFRHRGFTMGSLTALLAALARGGLQFMLIIWLQGIWLPLHGYSFEKTPLWAGIYMIPLTVGFLLAGPMAGRLADRYGARPFATLGLVFTAVAFLLFDLIPINFNYWGFAAILLLMGLSMGLFAAPNTSAVMNTLPASQRGAGAGMLTTFQNSASVLSIGVFFTVIALGLASSLPDAMFHGLTGQGVDPAKAHELANLPPIGSLFAAFLGFNPTEQLLGPDTLNSLPQDRADFLTGHTFFPNLISGPFGDGLHLAFGFAAIACVIAAVLSWLRGRDAPHARQSLRAEAAEGLAGVGELAAMEDGAGSPLPGAPSSSAEPAQSA
ncbi:Nitrate/nitrite transporter [Frankia canadensis]|uniref:Nitrate/nitrite transporter n=1 Tax=Frankia canadensis TaxID=1836972 RepID=A0A2I2KKN8_9ACTN|nr:MFS transporter [Frankia canadensis]SNQ46238.1 Nitrate/nitrite transporter [Frankia canadensis]SOU53528.1 Nitrate/nitrite transporter [Frankia canadensis]